MKKVKEYVQKNKKKLLIVTSILLVLTLTLSFAYFAGFIGPAANTDLNVGTGVTRKLIFTPGDDLSLVINQQTLAEGAGSVSDETISKATLTKDTSESSASDKYHVYYDITANNYVYTTNDSKPEIILTITDPEGNIVTTNDDVDYVSVTDTSTGETITGFDITTYTGLIRISEDYAITTTSQTVHNWTAKITFVNLDTNQMLNEGKNLTSQLILKHDKEPYPPHLFISASNTNYVGRNVSITCEDATASWNPYRNSVEITSLQKAGECTLSNTPSTATVSLDDYIVSLSGTTQGTGEVVNENGYRYEGKTPNNYIWFNEEMWRVIGVFDTTLADGTTTERLTKIIKADSLGGIAWDSRIVNNWNESTLKSLLNTSYLNSENGTGTENCYGYSTTVPTNCDYTQNGIKNEYKSMIENVTWNLGGLSSSSIAASAAFAAERSTTVPSGRPTTGTGYVGLMYPSDYMYSSLESSCSRTTTFDSYGSSICAGTNWMYGEGDEWTLTPDSSSSSYVWNLFSVGSGFSNSSRLGRGARPVLYLNSEVKYLDGAGSEANPLIVEM